MKSCFDVSYAASVRQLLTRDVGCQCSPKSLKSTAVQAARSTPKPKRRSKGKAIFYWLVLVMGVLYVCSSGLKFICLLTFQRSRWNLRPSLLGCPALRSVLAPSSIKRLLQRAKGRVLKKKIARSTRPGRAAQRNPYPTSRTSLRTVKRTVRRKSFFFVKKMIDYKVYRISNGREAK